MHSCCSDCDDFYFSEKIQFPAHCGTCNYRKSEFEFSHKLRIPKEYSIPSRKTSCHCLRELFCCHPCDNLPDCKQCLCYECRKIRGRSEALIHKQDQRSLSDHGYILLETWFTRFDSDGDGYLDLVDVESLLKHLGAKIHNSSIQKIFYICDRDCDGHLSFPEFVCLWHQAAHPGEDFIKKTRCPDLSHIIKKYKIFSDIHHGPCHAHSCKHITLATEYPIQQIKCKCGQRDKVIPYIKHEDVIHSSKKKVFKSKDIPAETDDDLPTMSKNRDDII